MRKIMLIIVISLICTTTKAAPVTEKQVQTAAETFISLRYPASTKSKARTVTSVGNSDLAVREITTLAENNNTVGFVVNLEPTGYVLMRSDDLCPPIKIYSDKGCFSNLPPNFISVIKWELETEIKELNKALKKKNNGISIEFNQQWKSLINSTKQNSILQTFSALSKKSGGPLLSTLWNQNNPYNYYAPDASGGSDGRAYAGCVATAMAQILKYHEWPEDGIDHNHSYIDDEGSCTGTFSASDCGLGDYNWEGMPNELDSNSSIYQIMDVSRLIYHCGVTVEMDFEHDGSGANSANDVPPALRNFFVYTCDNLIYKNSFTDTQWYTKIENDIDNQRPVYYRMTKSTGGGHAVVCDGCRNDDEIHLNVGYGDHPGTTWYNMNNVSFNGGSWINHGAILNINPDDGSIPQNDNFSDAINLSGNSGNTTGDSTGSTTETGEPAHADKGPYNSVWWKFTPSSNGKLDLNTHGSSFDTVLAMYIGSAVNNLTTKASNHLVHRFVIR